MKALSVEEEVIKLRLAIDKHAEEAALNHFRFIMATAPDWIKGHEAELKAGMIQYAKLGASEAMNYLRRNGHL